MFETLQCCHHALAAFRGRYVRIQEKGYPAHEGFPFSFDAMAARNSAS
jgi:hypothetical protein